LIKKKYKNGTSYGEYACQKKKSYDEYVVTIDNLYFLQIRRIKNKYEKEKSKYVFIFTLDC